MNPIASTLTFLRQNEAFASASKELFGSILPHLAMVMSRTELLDQALIQFGNFATVYMEGHGISRALDALHRKILPQPDETARNWLHLAKAAFIYGNMTSYVLVSPALRNGILTRVTGTTNFIDMVGLNGQKRHDPAVIKASSNRDFLTFAKIYGGGLAIASALSGLATFAAVKKLPVPKLMALFQKHLGLPEGNFSKFPLASAVLFWAYPAYAGLCHFSRDKVETKENLAKTAGFTLAFAILPRVLKNLVDKPAAGKTFRLVGPGENLSLLAEVVSACVFYAAIPTVLNLVLRKKRAIAEGLMPAGMSTNESSLPLPNPSAGRLNLPLPVSSTSFTAPLSVISAAPPALPVMSSLPVRSSLPVKSYPITIPAPVWANA